MNTKVTTNIRMDRADWINIKTMAVANNMSFNEYINFLANDSVVKSVLGEEVGRVGGKRKLDLRNLASEARKIKSEPESGFSDDDMAVYGGK